MQNPKAFISLSGFIILMHMGFHLKLKHSKYETCIYQYFNILKIIFIQINFLVV